MRWKFVYLTLVLLAIGNGLASGQDVLPQETGYWHFADNTSPRCVRCSATGPDGRLYALSETHPHLFCSRDGGATWWNIPVGTGDFLLYTFTIAANGEIYAAARYADKLFHSADQGETWQQLKTPTTDCRILKIHVDTKNRLYVIAKSDSGVDAFRSYDYGIHWEQLGHHLSCLLFWNGNIYAGTYSEGPSDYRDDFLVSADDGSTWSPLCADRNFFAFTDLLINSKGVLFAACSVDAEDRSSDVLICSQDGGMSWQSIHAGSAESQILLDASDNLIIHDGSYLDHYGLVISKNNGESWTKLPVRGSNALMDSSHNLLVFGTPAAGSSFYSIYRSSDQGISWIPIHQGFGPADYQYLILITPEGTIHAATGRAYRRSEDQGKSWFSLSFMDYKMENNYATAIARHPSGHLYITTSRDGIYRSIDEGNHWQKLTTGTADSSFMTLAIDQHGTIYAIGGMCEPYYVGNTSIFFRSTDNGMTWQRKTLNQNEPVITQIIPLDGGKMLAASGQEGDIYFSADQGDSWESEKIPLVRETWKMTYDPVSRQIFLMTDAGLYRRQNSWPAVWEKLQNDLPASIEDGAITVTAGILLVSWREKNMGAIYHFYFSSDRGNHWTKFDERSSVFSNCGVSTMAYHPQGVLFAGLGAGGSEFCESELFYCQAPFMSDAQVAPGEQGLTSGNLPFRFELSQNYPNPFNPSTAIRYTLPADGRIKLEVFDTLGKRVKILQEGLQTAGVHECSFQISDLASGIYFYRLTAGCCCVQKKMILLH